MGSVYVVVIYDELDSIKVYDNWMGAAKWLRDTYVRYHPHIDDETYAAISNQINEEDWIENFGFIERKVVYDA